MGGRALPLQAPFFELVLGSFCCSDQVQFGADWQVEVLGNLVLLEGHLAGSDARWEPLQEVQAAHGAAPMAPP